MRLIVSVILAFVLVSLSASPVSAVIKADLPLSQVYKSADDIITAKVEAVDAEKNLARLDHAVAFSELSKGRLGGTTKRSLVLQLDPEKTLAGKLAKGDAVVIFVAQKTGAIHVGDSWFLAQPATAPNWRLLSKQNLGTTFPGSTPSLIRALLELRAEKAPIVDLVNHHTWFGEQYIVQKLDVKVKAMASADVNGDKKADLLLVSDKGMRFYEGGGLHKPFEEATAKVGLASASARQIAFADVNGDGSADVLLDELYLNQGGKFVPSKSGIDLKSLDVLAVALMDANGDQRPDALVLTRDGILTIHENPGKDAAWKSSSKIIWKSSEPPFAAHIGLWGDDGKPHVMAIEKRGPIRYSLAGESADFKRLTGIDVPTSLGTPILPLDGFRASVAWDRAGGDGHLDLLIAKGKGAIELIGRGHGAFFHNRESRVTGSRNGKRFEPKVAAMAPADMSGNGSTWLLLLEENGDLWARHSPHVVMGKAIDKAK
jgi:hypothetical protein